MNLLFKKTFLSKVVGWGQKIYKQIGVEIFKFYLSIEKNTQTKRINDRANSPLVYWKISDNDFKMLDKWDSLLFIINRCLKIFLQRNSICCY